MLESKLTAVGYGFLVPFFFVTSGMAFDLDALVGAAILSTLIYPFVALALRRHDRESSTGQPSDGHEPLPAT